MEKFLKELKEILVKELELETSLKALKEEKNKLLQKILLILTVDHYSTDFCSLRKGFDVTALTEAGSKRFGKAKALRIDKDLVREALRIDKDLVREALEAGEDLHNDLEIVEKLIVYKKKGGLE